jgi:DNA-binding response OmpR family regulator
MTPQDPNDVPGQIDPDDPEAALRDARQRFVAAFPKRSDSIGLMLAVVSTLGQKGPIAPLRQIVHRTAGLAGTLGFPAVSVRARELEELLDAVESGQFDATAAGSTFEALQAAFTGDLGNPPVWAGTGPPGGHGHRVMVVEDDEDQREVVTINLRAAGYVAIPVSSGSDAVAVARAHHPDLVLLDANLPGIDGYTVCRLLKTDPDLAGMPVVFMTVRAGLDDRMVGLMLGADDYLVKPIDMAELMLRIQILVGRHSRAMAPPPLPAGSGELQDLDYESFSEVAREQLSLLPGTLALIRVPESRLNETYLAVRSESRRRDFVACYNPTHLILLMAEMPIDRARERLTDVITRLAPGGPPRFHIGLAESQAGGMKTLEMLLAEADVAIATARERGVLLAVSGEDPLATDPGVGTRGTIVLADDDPEVARLVEAQLRASGYRTIVAPDGMQAVEAIAANRPDVVIIDVMMPRMTGFDVLMKLRSQPARPRVIVLSARGREQDVTRAFALGADDYMTKPFSPPELLARIERLLR